MKNRNIFILLLGILIGSVSTYFYFSQLSQKPNFPNQLRLGRDKYINPLLACNFSNPDPPILITKLKSELKQLIEVHIAQGNITNTGIYLRNLNSSDSIAINENEKFYPASLNKIPIMITAYKTAQKNPEYLNQKITIASQNNFNSNQEIVPKDTVIPGQTYTIQNVVAKMITDSDNNSFYALSQYLEPELFHATYQDLQIPLVKDTQSITDYMTPESFSYFFRVLYNATYLNSEYSQKALELLTQIKYENGLRAQIPKEIPIAHKFGLLTNTTNGQPTSRELHDCGIVYYPNNPYLLCIMTKSTAPIEKIESYIQDISQTIYKSISSQG